MNHHLRSAIAAPAFRQRLAALAEGADASTLISLGIDLAPGNRNWLDCLPGPLDDYWYWAQPARRDYRLGLGTALQVASSGPSRFAALDNSFAGFVQHWHGEHLPGAFIGFAFDEQARGELPNALLAVPAILLHTHDGRSRAVFTTVAGEAATAIERWRNLLSAPKASESTGCMPARRHFLAERAWLARVEAALHGISSGRLSKVVLARSVKLRANARIAAAPVLAALLESQTSSTLYAHANRQSLFLGASPECLVSLKDGRAEADALAGTAWPDPVAETASSRLEGDKNIREQQLVVDAVQAALSRHCTHLEPALPPGILQLPSLSHLHTRLRGLTTAETNLFDLICSLHPTPAVGGSPTVAALDWLRAHGEKRGGWYSGGIGHIAANGDGEIAVALRCALINGHEAELYAGAGIVTGSQAVQELAETEAKLATMRDALERGGTSALARTGTQ